jgi:hypothetical protein
MRYLANWKKNIPKLECPHQSSDFTLKMQEKSLHLTALTPDVGSTPTLL